MNISENNHVMMALLLMTSSAAFTVSLGAGEISATRLETPGVKTMERFDLKGQYT